MHIFNRHPKSKNNYQKTNVLMVLEMISCEFGRVCAWRNAFILLETILCKFGQNLRNRKCSYAFRNYFYKFGRICERINAFILLETILCEFGWICATGNTPRQLEKVFFPVLTDFCGRKCSFASGSNFAQVSTKLLQETVLWKHFLVKCEVTLVLFKHRFALFEDGTRNILSALISLSHHICKNCAFESDYPH